LIELEADLDEHLERNKSEFRLSQKPTKREVKKSETELLKSAKDCRLNSLPGEVTSSHYLRVNNTNIAPDVVAAQIKKTFIFE